MKRADAQKAVDDAFADGLSVAYRNILMMNLAAPDPDVAGTTKQFRKALAINVAAHAMASQAVAESPDIEKEKP